MYNSLFFVAIEMSVQNNFYFNSLYYVKVVAKFSISCSRKLLLFIGDLHGNPINKANFETDLFAYLDLANTYWNSHKRLFSNFLTNLKCLSS